MIVRWDGSNWQDSSRNLTPTNVRAGCGLSGDDAWLVGDAGSTYRWRGLAFTPVPTPTTNSLKEVWCGPPSIPGMPTDAVWAIGENGTALFWNGFDWSVAATGLPESLTGITGSSNNDVWISGTSTLYAPAPPHLSPSNRPLQICSRRLLCLSRHWNKS